MAIEKVVPPKSGKYHYRVRYKPTAGRDGKTVYFETRPKAKKWQEQENVRRRNTRYGLHDIQDLKKYTASDIIIRFMVNNPAAADYETKEELFADSDLADNVRLKLHEFIRRPFFKEINLYDFTKEVAEKFLEDRKKETWKHPNWTNTEATLISPRTVRREKSMLQGVWNWARKNIPDLVHLTNPWDGIRVPGSTGGKRQRGLKKGELEALLKHCEGCLGTNRYYVPLAIQFAFSTGMRRQEIFNLTWQDIDFGNRRITIRKSKTDFVTGNEGRVICLPPLCWMPLKLLHSSLLLDGRTPGRERFAIPKEFHLPAGKIFLDTDGNPMTGEAFKQAFDSVAERAGINRSGERKANLKPHDLRAAAESAFRKSELDDKEIDIMKNGPKSHYDVVEDFLSTIQSKLETACFGAPLEEVEKEQRDRITLSYPMQCGVSLEDIIKLGDWLFDPNFFETASAQARLAEEAE